MRWGRIAVTAVPILGLVGCSIFASLDDIHVGDGTATTTAGDAATDSTTKLTDGGISDAPSDGSDAASLTFRPPCGSAPLAAGLVAYWPFDGDTNNVVPGGPQLSPNEGSSNTPITFDAGLIGQALWPGIGTDYTCPNCTTLKKANAIDFTGDFTISLWAKKSPSPNTDNTWWHYAMMGNDQFLLGAWSSNSAPTPAYPKLILVANGTETASAQSSALDFRAASESEVWVHVLARRAGDALALYVDGTATTTTGGSVNADSGAFYLAADNSGYPWQGLLDEVAIWKRALTPAEIAQLYNGGTGCK